jgi:uncharacterized membrane protein YciS (DUF1049 family)
MAWFKRLALLLLVVALLLLGLWFSAENTARVAVVLLGFPMPEVAQGVLLLAVLLLGAMVGFVASVLPLLRLTNRNMSLARKLKRRDLELERLRKAPLVDNSGV